MIEALVVCLVITVSFFIGIWFGRMSAKKTNALNGGKLVINTSDPKKDVMRFELETQITQLINGDQVIFAIEKEE